MGKVVSEKVIQNRIRPPLDMLYQNSQFLMIKQIALARANHRIVKNKMHRSWFKDAGVLSINPSSNAALSGHFPNVYFRVEVGGKRVAVSPALASKMSIVLSCRKVLRSITLNMFRDAGQIHPERHIPLS